MRAITISIVLSLFFLEIDTARAQSNKHDVTLKNAYEFYNGLAQMDSLGTFYLEDSATSYDFVLKRLSEVFKEPTFTSSDTIFFNSQLKRPRIRWSVGRIKGSKIITAVAIKSTFQKGGWHEYEKKFKKGFHTFAMPLFTIDSKKCIVYSDYHCGSLCGSGDLQLFERIKGKWIRVRTYTHWDS